MRKHLLLITGLIVIAGNPARTSPQTGEITGTVRSYDGRAIVAAVAIYRPYDQRPTAKTTARNGRFQLRRIPRGHYTLVVENERLSRRETALTVNGGRTAKITLELDDETPPTTPTLISATAASNVASIDLRWSEASDSWSDIDHYDISWTGGNAFGQTVARTTEATLKELEPYAEYEVRVRAVDGAGSKSAWSNSQKARTVAIRNLQGRLIDAWQGQQPVNRATVTLTGGGSVTTIWSDEAGRYEFWGLRSGDYQLKVGATGYVGSEQIVKIDSRQELAVDISLTAYSYPWLKLSKEQSLSGYAAGLTTDGQDGTIAIALWSASWGIKLYDPQGGERGFLATPAAPQLLARHYEGGVMSYLVSANRRSWITDSLGARSLTLPEPAAMASYPGRATLFANGISLYQLKNNGAVVVPTATLTGPISALATSRYSTYLACGNQLYRFDINFETVVANQVSLPFSVGYLAQLDNSRALLASESDSGRLYLLDARTLAVIDLLTLPAEGGPVTGLATINNSFLVTTGRKLYRLENGR